MKKKNEHDFEHMRLTYTFYLQVLQSDFLNAVREVYEHVYETGENKSLDKFSLIIKEIKIFS